MTALLNNTVVKSFDPAIRGHVRTALSKFRTRMLDRTQHGYYPDADTEQRVTALLNELDSLPLNELLDSLRPFDDGIIRRSIPEVPALPGNTSFVGPDPATEGGALQVLRLGAELGKAWPESEFELTVHEPESSSSQETIRATTVREGIKYMIDLGPSVLTLSADEPSLYLEGEWSMIADTYRWVSSDSSWRSAASMLSETRVMAILTRGLDASNLVGGPELEIDCERPSLVFEVDGHRFELDANHAFTGSNQVPLPQLVADGIFAELARVAGLEPTAETGREEMAKVFVGL